MSSPAVELSNFGAGRDSREEDARLLVDNEEPSDNRVHGSAAKIKTYLYLEQFISDWHMWYADYSLVVFLADQFPGTLVYVSVYTLLKALAAVLLSSWAGTIMDRMDRLFALKWVIISHRCSIAFACASLYLLKFTPGSGFAFSILLLLFMLLACVERVTSIANVVALERDWVIVVAHNLKEDRQHLNVVMRRLDLFSKLAGPFVLSCIDTYSRTAAMLTLVAATILSVPIELHIIQKLRDSVPGLKIAPTLPLELETEREMSPNILSAHTSNTAIAQALVPASITQYISSVVFLPSFSLALIYLTVLSIGAQTITYLVASDFTSLQVSVIRGVSVITELAGTWIVPPLMERIGVVRAGFWLLAWQVASISLPVTIIAMLDTRSKFVAICLVSGICVKRLGLWGFDLAVQYIVQGGTPPPTRARFSSTEAACQNLFEVLASSLTIIFAKPDEFRYAVYVSYAVLVVSLLCYMRFLRQTKGHAPVYSSPTHF
ncbi:hypothetical protein EJ04DRAFT_547345 [Polyplosphaeria fusca]|uniref:Solute carrier family 40 member n=1 Tax=Polyplosphaeria fusca TaxID=682080 RepID=A0A9P4USX3_9PLEO|nr:hypothetical protein EJ04DRAFT_547345 [Polyplosphaeria fusca]